MLTSSSDNFEQPWVFKKDFDYIHGRVLGGTVGDFGKFHEEAFNALKPGGWLEMQDFESYFFCDDDTMTPDCWMSSWISNMNKGSVKFGKAFNAIASERKFMEDAGFVDIRSQVIKVSGSVRRPWRGVNAYRFRSEHGQKIENSKNLASSCKFSYSRLWIR